GGTGGSPSGRRVSFAPSPARARIGFGGTGGSVSASWGSASLGALPGRSRARFPSRPPPERGVGRRPSPGPRGAAHAGAQVLRRVAEARGVTIDELYALPGAEFVAARDTMARELTKAGKKDEAATVRALRRPTQAAEILNAVARSERATVDRLVRAGGALRKALSKGDRAKVEAA